jgi:demethylmenaquinone methyltransferase/2-methoxy-6-polyprenyl-1,4-benzoquinol methylase
VSGDAELPQGAEKEQAVRAMFDRIAPRYDLVNRIMTFGMDVGWRKRAVRELRLPADGVVADVACGTGDFCREVIKIGRRAVGFDVSFGMLEAARTDAPLVQADGLKLPLRAASVDAVTCGFALRNVLDIPTLFEEMARVVKPGGRIAIIEVGQPRSAVTRTGHAFYFRKVVPLIGGALSDREAYRYLPRSTAYLPPSEELIASLQGVGFKETQVKQLGLGAAQLITASR